jgi:hypothetical protein
MLSPAVYAAEADTNALVSKVFAAAIAFAVAVAAAVFTISKAGSAGLAASAERPEVRGRRHHYSCVWRGTRYLY